MLSMNDHTSRHMLLSLLYVDDEPILLDLGKRFLERSSEFTVVTFPCAKDALHALNQQKFDAIVSDYEMPEMNGVAFLKEVREKFGSIPFILFTGRGREEVVIEAINNGANYYLQKGGDPVSQYAELAHKIRQAVKVKAAEMQVIESQKTLFDIINFLPDPVIVRDTAGKILAWNRANERTSGIPARDILGKDNYEYALVPYGKRRPLLLDLIDEPDEEILKYYHTIRRNGDTITAESDSIQLQGKPFTPLVTACPLYNHSGERSGSIEVIHDISDLKKVQQELQKSEERYRLIIDAQADMILSITPDLQIPFMNESCRSFIADKLVLENPVSMSAHQVCQVLLPDYKVILASLTVLHPDFEIERCIVTSQNNQYCFHFSLRALFDQEGHLYEYQMVARDITRFKEAERVAIEREQALLAFMGAIPHLVSIIDETGRIIEWNDQSERLTGLSKDVVLNRPFQDIFRLLNPPGIHVQPTKGIEDQIQASLITGEPMRSPPFVCEISSTDGRLFTLNQVFFPIKTEIGYRIGLISQDSTDRKEIEDGRQTLTD